MKKKLEDLLAEWRKKQKYFHDAAIQLSGRDGEESFASNRYEGESYGIRWCAEDLEKLLYDNRPLGPKDFPLGGDEDYGDDPL